ncbi:MAG: holo-ACP synthase [Chitinophagaceae bacterium]
MITGIGTDIIEVERIAEKIGKEQGFRELVFSAGEISYCESTANKYQHYAARFAAKEAFFKAMGTGWADGTAFNEIEITQASNGKPLLVLTGATANWAQQKAVGTVSVSLSHVKTIATAVVIIES